MQTMKWQIEQRRHKRFQVRDDAFVLLGPDSTKLGRIIDISMRGLAFSHVGRAKPPGQFFELDIFLIDTDLYIDKIPFETISDFTTLENSFSSITLRRCGVEFGVLTHDQIAQLERFVEHHTIADA